MSSRDYQGLVNEPVEQIYDFSHGKGDYKDFLKGVVSPAITLACKMLEIDYHPSNNTRRFMQGVVTGIAGPMIAGSALCLAAILNQPNISSKSNVEQIVNEVSTQPESYRSTPTQNQN